MKSSSSSSSLIYYIILNFLHLVWHSIIYHSLSMKDSNSTMKFLLFNLLSLAIPNLYFFLIFFSILLKNFFLQIEEYIRKNKYIITRKFK